MDIQALFEHAKESILESGSHAPMVFVEEEDGTFTMFFLAVNLPENMTTREKEYMFFAMGRQFRQERDVPLKIKQLCFLSEAWGSHGKPGEERKYRFPSQDPNRREVLMAMVLDVPGMQQSAHMAEMLRLKSGELHDLLHDPDLRIGEVKSNLLPSFLSGAQFSYSAFSQWKRGL